MQTKILKFSSLHLVLFISQQRISFFFRLAEKRENIGFSISNVCIAISTLKHSDIRRININIIVILYKNIEYKIFVWSNFFVNKMEKNLIQTLLNTNKHKKIVSSSQDIFLVLYVFCTSSL